MNEYTQLNWFESIGFGIETEKMFELRSEASYSTKSQDNIEQL